MKNTLESKCLVVLSGGQDSTTCLFWAKDRYDVVHAVTFDYGQRHRIEIEAAKRVAKMAGVASHEIIEFPQILKSTSPLVSGTPLEQYSDPEQMAQVIGNRVELTFVPLRNTMFLTVAANRAVALGCYDIITGICQEDNANYPDCTEQYRQDFEVMLNQSLGCQPLNYQIIAPLMYLDKAESVRLATTLEGCMEALAYSHTSYDGKYPPTDMNHSNVLRADGFHKAGESDPLVVRAWKEGLMALPATSNYDGLRAQDQR